MNNYYSIYNESIDPHKRNLFWFNQTKEISYFIPPKLSNSLTYKKKPFYNWFPDSELNICFNCIDRHLKTLSNSPAIIYESFYLNKNITYTYYHLFKEVNILSKILIDKCNVNKGDVIIIYMPTIPQGIFSMLACTRIGAVHSVVFGGFSVEELAERIFDCDSKVVITASCGFEPKRIVEYYSVVCKAVEICENKKKANNNNSIKILLYNREDSPLIYNENTISSNTIIYNNEYRKLLNKNINIKPIHLKSSDLFYILYTSGTSSQPKGIYHDLSNIITINFTMKYIMNFNSKDKIFSTSDIGWIVGHIFIVYGPLLRGGTTCIFEGKPTNTPNCYKIWEIISKHNIKCFYTSPTALRAIRECDEECLGAKMHNVSRCLESIHLSGEKCDEDTFLWLKKNIGEKVLINDQWWQTETGWPICCNNKGIYTFKIKEGIAGPPLMGYKIKIIGDQNNNYNSCNSSNYEVGRICIQLPMPPGFMKGLYGNEKIFISKYFTSDLEYYITGDIGYINNEGFLCVLGREDDVIKVAGHRLSTGRIEEVVNEVEEVIECAVVGMKDKIKGEVPVAFIVINNNIINNSKSINNNDYNNNSKIIEKCSVNVINKIGRISALKKIIVVKKLPKNKSGKIIRKLLKNVINNEKIFIPPTIEDKYVVSDILKQINKFKL